MSDSAPSERDQSGRFLKGNRAGRGNPNARRAQRLRSAAMRAVGSDDIVRVLRALVEAAAGGDVQASRLLLERCLGRPRDEGQPLPVPPDFDGSAGSLLQAAQVALQQAESPSEAQAALGVLARLSELTALASAEERLRRLEEGR